MFPTDEYIRERYKELLGDIDSLVGEERSRRIADASEYQRALWIVQSTHGKMPLSKAMGLYMVRPDVAKEILEQFDADEIQPAAKARKEKYSAIREWCEENVGVQTTPRQIAEIGEISYPTALKYISDRPDVFWKVARGTFEVRDPAADRQKEKK